MTLSQSNISQINTLPHLVFVILLSVFFLPPIKLFGFGIRVDDVLTLIIVPFIVLHFAEIQNNKYLKPLFFF